MADQLDDDDILDGADLVKDLRRQIKNLSKEKADLAAELSTVKAATRERSVADVLTARGVNAKVAKFIPADVEGEEALNAWLEENADVFGFKISDPAATPDPSDVADAKRLQSLGQSAQTPTRVQDLEARLANAKDEAEIQAIWAEAKEFFL